MCFVCVCQLLLPLAAVQQYLQRVLLSSCPALHAGYTSGHSDTSALQQMGLPIQVYISCLYHFNRTRLIHRCQQVGLMGNRNVKSDNAGIQHPTEEQPYHIP